MKTKRELVKHMNCIGRMVKDIRGIIHSRSINELHDDPDALNSIEDMLNDMLHEMFEVGKEIEAKISFRL